MLSGDVRLRPVSNDRPEDRPKDRPKDRPNGGSKVR